MNEPTKPQPQGATRAPEFWESRNGRILALVGLLVVSLSLLFGNLSGLGIWEPWEANEIAVAQEYATRGAAPPVTQPRATSWNWAVPTHNKRPVDRPLLSTAILAAQVGDLEVDADAVGRLERSARLPFALAALLMVLVGALWTHRRFGAYRAAVVGAVFVTLPAVYLGVHNLTSEMLYVVTTTLAILAFFEAAYDRSVRRWLWGLGFGAFLALAVFDQRLMGLYLPLFVISAFVATEAALAEVVRRRDGPSAPAKIGPVEIVGAAFGLGACAAVLVWGWFAGKPDAATKFTPYVLQIVAMTVVPCLVFAGLWFGRRSTPGRAFWGGPGLLGAAIGAGAAVFFAYSYSDANPILLDGGEMFGDVRVFGYMLSNHVFERSLAEGHMSFDIVMRQVGFSLFPWAALFPAGLAYIARSTQVRDDDGEERSAGMFGAVEAAKRLILVWMVAAAIAVGAGSLFDHYFYPAYFPIAACIGLVLTDAEFWSGLRSRPLAGYAMGFVAVMIILMLGKDLERYPIRFVETYLTLQEGFELPEDYSWGSLYKPLKYGWMLFLIAFFFGLVSWAILAFRSARRAPELWRAIRRRDWPALSGGPSDAAPFIRRAAEKEAVRAENTIPARIARFVETPVGFGPLAVLVFWLSALLFLFVFVPNVTNHLSQRGVFETYTRLADSGEELYRYQVTSRDNSVYLQDVEQMKGASEFDKAFSADERFFAVVPRSKLAAINYDVRSRHRKNLHVLDARSSRLLLVSNKLEEGEEDYNFVADKIVEGEPDIEYPVEFETADGKKHPVFDGQLEFLGYSLNHPAEADGLAEYGWGDEMVITYFFRVLKRVPSSQKIFLHVDFPGNRINGDHYPNDGEFPTNYWLPGDVVKDVHKLTIDSYSSPGIYTLNMGFFLGSRRMKVEPREAHDGRDRITIGKIEVTSGL